MADLNEVQISKRQYHLIGDMMYWLRENVGDGGWAPVLDARWHIESAFGNSTFIFKDGKDATLFALKWLPNE